MIIYVSATSCRQKLPSLSSKFSIPLIQEERIHEQLADLDEHKTKGLDGVSAKLLRLASPVITRSITNILNTSINTGHFPTKWKMGRLTPIYKAGNKSECNNFRPITILCTLMPLSLRVATAGRQAATVQIATDRW